MFEHATLGCTEMMRRAISNTQCSDLFAPGGSQRMTRIKPQEGLTGHEWIIRKTHIKMSVWNDQNVVIQDRVGTEGKITRRFAHLNSDPGLKHLTVLVDE